MNKADVETQIRIESLENVCLINCPFSYSCLLLFNWCQVLTFYEEMGLLMTLALAQPQPQPPA
jgi:hypothetical protein